jgi:hypothetical protein
MLLSDTEEKQKYGLKGITNNSCGGVGEALDNHSGVSVSDHLRAVRTIRVFDNDTKSGVGLNRLSVE